MAIVGFMFSKRGDVGVFVYGGKRRRLTKLNTGDVDVLAAGR